MSKIALEGNASGTGTLTIASQNTNSNYTLTLPNSTGTLVVTGGAQTIEFAAGTAASPSITFTGDTNTGIFSPGADTIAFSEGGAEAMRIDSSGNVGIGTSSPTASASNKTVTINGPSGSGALIDFKSNETLNFRIFSGSASSVLSVKTATPLIFDTNDTERMRIDSSGRVGIGTTSMSSYAPGNLSSALSGDNYVTLQAGTSSASGINMVDSATSSAVGLIRYQHASDTMDFFTAGSQRVVITSGGDLCVGRTATFDGERIVSEKANAAGLSVNRTGGDGNLVRFYQDGTEEGNISVSGNTVSYNAFSGGHFSQLQQGRGYNPEILRGTVMSSIGEMCEWKSVVWDEVIEHPAVPAVDAKDAVLDEEGNVIEPAVEAVEGKDAWTETINKREAYLGNLAVGATFTEDGVTKTVVDDGNERLPKVKISDVVGDKAVYGVFQTWDEVQDMLVTSLGAFVVRIAAGVTVQIGDLLESNGDGCAKVQDDDVIRSKTIGKVTSTTPSATYADGSYTVPAVLYCG